MPPTSRSTAPVYFLCFLAVYALILSLLAPLATKPAGAASRQGANSAKEYAPVTGNPKRELSVIQAAQQGGRREGELLVRFRIGVSDQDKAGAVAPHGARRRNQLRGESGIEKLELAAGENVETAAAQLRLHPAIEFAEPNFLIQRDDFGLEAGVEGRLTRPPQPG